LNDDFGRLDRERFSEIYPIAFIFSWLKLRLEIMLFFLLDSFENVKSWFLNELFSDSSVLFIDIVSVFSLKGVVNTFIKLFAPFDFVECKSLLFFDSKASFNAYYYKVFNP